ncbi:MAG TPA: SdrD B-like domain-containing protein, partial [Lacipirellula sp.]
ISYTVRVINDGPSTAKSVQFVDNLPDGVTYKSHTVSKGGITLSHSGGSLTGSFGNMAAGEVIIVTILAEVKATATGILLNEAEVSAPDEENILNNRDEVETPVTPKIDLAIDKIDSKDPVKPGEQFTYTVTVTNNGPSGATGVTVIDTLPATGVSYVGASIPVSASEGILIFDLGNLASGASTTFTITVQVANTFSGTLLNTVDVSGNEEETDYTNNQDTEPTLVKLDPAKLGGHVYVDKNNNGVFDPGERPIANVLISLSGVDIHGNTVTQTTSTNASGAYSFNNLTPGTYNVVQTNQPNRYRDGKDTLGLTFDGEGIPMTTPNGFPAFDQNVDDDRDGDAFQEINLDGGFAALDYNFGELAVTTSKVDFIRPIFYR